MRVSISTLSISSLAAALLASALATPAAANPSFESFFDRLEEAGERAQQARGVRSRASDADYNDLDRRGRAAQQARQNSFEGQRYRSHAVRLGTDPNWRAVEQRGINAQRSRPNHLINGIDDLTPQERLRLDRQGRAAQRARGARLPTTPHRGVAVRQGYPGAIAANARRGGVRPTTRSTGRFRGAGTAAQAALRADLVAEAVGGRDIGVGTYASDMTLGQAQTFARGGDPVRAAHRATGRLGRNFIGGVRGVGETVRDPRKLPGNVARAGVNTVRGVGETVIWAGRGTARTARDAARMTHDPRFAKRQVRKAGRTITNVGKSVCKAASYITLGLKKKHCK
ncbi:MAG: hypothetical protein AAGL10_14920 [Pseudomonadota bacterium]